MSDYNNPNKGFIKFKKHQKKKKKLESGKIHAVCGNGFLTVTPGVRFADGA